MSEIPHVLDLVRRSSLPALRDLGRRGNDIGPKQFNRFVSSEKFQRLRAFLGGSNYFRPWGMEQLANRDRFPDLRYVNLHANLLVLDDATTRVLSESSELAQTATFVGVSQFYGALLPERHLPNRVLTGEQWQD